MIMKAILASCAALGASAAVAGGPVQVQGTWERMPLPGVAGFSRLTFTADGRLMVDRTQLLGRYEVRERRVTARSSFGEVYEYELTSDGRLCVYPGPGVMPLAGENDAKLSAGQCFRRSAREA